MASTPRAVESAHHPDRVTAQPVPDYMTAQGRDLRLDLLRGFCVLAMIVNHISGASPLYLLTGGDRFFTSAAGGFILVSGFTAGMVYRKLVARDGLVASMTRGWQRAINLYLLTVGLTFFIVPVSEYFRLPWASGTDLTRALKFVVSVLTLHQTYTLVNVMLLYTLLFMALPLALLLLAQGRARVVLLASWLLWLLYQIYPDAATFPWTIAGGYLFAFSAWQVLFCTTLVLGYQRDTLPRLSPRSLCWLHALAGLATAAFIGYYAFFNLPVGLLPAPLQGLRAAGQPVYDASLEMFFVKARVGPGRILAAAAVFGFIALSLTRWWQPLARWLKPLLLPLGQHALYAWTVHIILIVILGLGLKALGLTEADPRLNTALQIGVVALIWALTRWQFLAVTPRTRRYWRAVPVVLALVALVVLQLPQFDVVPGEVSAEMVEGK